MVSLNYVKLILLISLVALFTGPLPSKVAGDTRPTGFESILVVGIVFCKSCKLIPTSVSCFLPSTGYVDTAPVRNDATPLPGATVNLTCQDSYGNYNSLTAVSSPTCGTFSIAWPLVSTFVPSKCSVFLQSPSVLRPDCSVPLYPLPGSSGAPLYLINGSGKEGIYTPGIVTYGDKNTPCPFDS